MLLLHLQDAKRTSFHVGQSYLCRHALAREFQLLPHRSALHSYPLFLFLSRNMRPRPENCLAYSPQHIGFRLAPAEVP